jgi:hypothetical protein
VARLRRSAPTLLLLLALAGAVLVPTPEDDSLLRLATPDRSRVGPFQAAIAGLPADGLVLVAFDADFGTYAEIRSTTRAALADLLGRGARLAFVSFTAEGRAIAAAELDRLRRGEGASEPGDLGFVAGSEAGLVRAISSVVPSSAIGLIADEIRRRGGGLAAFDLVLVVSGSDISARSWVEQVGARLPALSLLAIAPTFVEPELAPYLQSGQLTAMLATLREGAAYARAIPSAAGDQRGTPPGPLPMLIGMLAALTVLAEAAGRRLFGRGRAP